MVKIARVFPSRTSFTPTDKDAYYGTPELFMPEYDEIHISCTFTWDLPYAEQLSVAWLDYGKVIKGGCAYGDPGSEFVPGMYVKHGVTIT
jgi:hypothetical protein